MGGAEVRVRALTEVERSEVQRRRAADFDAARSLAFGRVRALGWLAMGLLVAGAVGFWFELGFLRFVGTVSGGMIGVILFGTRGQIEKGLRAKGGPWVPPKAGWQVEETTLGVTAAFGWGLRDGERVVLVQTRDGWWFLAPGRLPPFELRATMHLVRLAPDGPVLTVEGRGQPVALEAPPAQAGDLAAAFAQGAYGPVAAAPDWVTG